MILIIHDYLWGGRPDYEGDLQLCIMVIIFCKNVVVSEWANTSIISKGS